MTIRNWERNRQRSSAAADLGMVDKLDIPLNSVNRLLVLITLNNIPYLRTISSI